MSAHLVWDWNGTLFHDIDAVIEATNASFAEIGLPPITLERYRELYCVPVPLFYERLMGRLPTDDEWEVMDEIFHRHYWALAERAALARRRPGAARRVAGGRAHPVAVLAGAARAADTPGAYARHRATTSSGWTAAPGTAARGKAEQMVRHLAAMSGVPRSASW